VSHIAWLADDSMGSNATQPSNPDIDREQTPIPGSEQRVRTPAQRDRLATLPDAEDGFEPHDTIPAPTWLDEQPELEKIHSP
jgi:hypothetical protein